MHRHIWGCLDSGPDPPIAIYLVGYPMEHHANLQISKKEWTPIVLQLKDFHFVSSIFGIFIQIELHDTVEVSAYFGI